MYAYNMYKLHTCREQRADSPPVKVAALFFRGRV